jgi:AcrR family transcriptional regulator
LSLTKDKILNVAETLFSEYGFSETSLRAITTQANVNLASVNYHFGSKKILIQSVFERFMDPFVQDLTLEIKQLENSETIHVSNVLQTLKQPIKNLDQLRPHGSGVFMNLLGRSYTEMQGHVKRFAMTKYAHIFKRFVHLLQKANPHLSQLEMFWKLHFMLGSFIFSLAGHKVLQEISQRDFGENLSIEGIIDQLIHFMVNAFYPLSYSHQNE